MHVTLMHSSYSNLICQLCVMMEEEGTALWDIVVKRWKDSKQEYADAITKLMLAQTRLMKSLSQLRTRFCNMEMDNTDGLDNYRVGISHKESRVYPTRLHRLLYGDSIHQVSEEDREISRGEELKRRASRSALRIRMSYVIEQVEQFFKHELRSNEVFLLLDRAHCLELQIKLMLQSTEQFNHCNVL